MANRSSRRKFLQTAAVGAAALTPATLTQAQAAQATDPPSVVQSLTDIVRRRYGKHLTEAQIKNVQTAIQGDLVSADALKRVRLENGDEPAFTFVPDVD